MIEMLVKIPGPTFLIIFTGLSAVCILAAWWWATSRDDSAQHPLPEPDSLDAIEIAALRGGLRGGLGSARGAIIETVIFDLWRRNLVQLTGEGSNARIQGVPSDLEPERAIEKAIYQSAQTEKRLSQLYSDGNLARHIKDRYETIVDKLDRLHLRRTATARRQGWVAFWSASLIIGVVGGTKLILGHSRGRPIGFLTMLLFISFYALWVVLNLEGTTSQLGRRYLKSLKQHFAWLNESLRSGQEPKGINPTLDIAIFGVRALAGVSLFQSFTNAFRQPLISAFLGSGGGGGGGGCGGGGCGGGGCGGCGG